MKLADSQLNLDHPVWIDDEDFQLRRHLHRVGLPPPGRRRELAETCGHIAGLPLDRDHPLWEMWAIEGGTDADTLAVMLKAHHAIVDGVGGANLMAQLCSAEPDAPPPEPGAGSAHPLRIAAGGAVRLALRPWRLAQHAAKDGAHAVTRPRGTPWPHPLRPRGPRSTPLSPAAATSPTPSLTCETSRRSRTAWA
jgi:hypothetical protein